MATVRMDAELVRVIAERVVGMLREQGLAVAPTVTSPAVSDTRAAAPKPATAGRPASGAPGPRKTGNLGKTAPPKPAPRIFITAEGLESRLASGGKGDTVELACNEFLTPNASDLAEAKRLTIRRASAQLPQAEVNPPACPSGMTALATQTLHATVTSARALGGGIGVVTAKTDEKIQILLESLAREGLGLLNCNRGDCWIANLLAACRDLATGGLLAVVAIVPHATDAMLLAGKVKGARAVQGTSTDTVARAVRKFAANVLILEAASSTFHQMRAMIRLLAAGGLAAPQPSALQAALDELER